MDKQVRYSVVPVGQQFRYKNEIYTKSSCGRAIHYYDSKVVTIRVKKHDVVEWLNAYPSQLEA